MKWIKEPFLDGLVIIGMMLIVILSVVDEWLDRQHEAKARIRANDVGALKEERWYGYLFR